MNRASIFIISIFCIVIFVYVIMLIFRYESRVSAKHYRDVYREQGREQVRAEALEAGVAEIVQGEFEWGTNSVGIITGCEPERDSCVNDIYQVVIEALENRRDSYAKRSESKSEEAGDRCRYREGEKGSGQELEGKEAGKESGKEYGEESKGSGFRPGSAEEEGTPAEEV